MLHFSSANCHLCSILYRRGNVMCWTYALPLLRHEYNGPLKVSRMCNKNISELTDASAPITVKGGSTNLGIMQIKRRPNQLYGRHLECHNK